MSQMHLTATVYGYPVEGDYKVEGNRLYLSSALGSCDCPTGGIPNDILATLLLRDLFRTANLVKPVS